MPVVPLPISSREVVRMTFRFAMSEGAGIAQTHLDLTPTASLTVATPQILLDLVGVVQVDAMAELRACITEECELTQIIATSLKNPALLPAISTPGVDGTVADETMPSFVQVSLQKRTAIGGRSGLGRMQMPGVPETFTAENYVSALGTAAYDALCAEFMGGFLTAAPDLNWFPCLAKRDTFDPATGLWILRSADLVTLARRSLLGTQRKRIVGRGI